MSEAGGSFAGFATSAVRSLGFEGALCKKDVTQQMHWDMIDWFVVA